MIISATSITDGNKLDELIKYANSLNCKAFYSEQYKGTAIDTSGTRADKLIKAKIKELEKISFLSRI